MALTSADVQRAFQNALGREASETDELNYVNLSQTNTVTDTQIYAVISNSPEANLNTDPVIRFYQAAFGRVPDKAGLDNATDYIRQFGATPETYQKLADMFAQSPEFQARFPGTGVTAEYVQDLYTTILGRQATTAEIQAYVSGSNGYDTRGEVLYAISQSNEAITRTDAAVNSFLLDATEGDAVYMGPLPGSSSGEPTQPTEPTTPTQPTNPGTGGGSTPSVPTTFTLTTAADTYPGTANDDTINGTVGSESTFTTIDRINGAGGTDTFNITVTKNDGNGGIAIPLAQTNPETGSSTPTVTSVEIFNIRNTSGQEATFNAAAIAGEQQVWNDQSTSGSVSVTGLAAGATIGVRGNTTLSFFNPDPTDTRFTYANPTDAVTIAVDGGVGFTTQFGPLGPTITRAQTGEATVTINSTGAANILGRIDLDNDAATITSVTINATTGLNAILSADDYAADATLTLTGPGPIDLQRGSLSATITTINAANSSGGVNIRADNTANLIFTGGKGDDTLHLGSTLTAADSIDGGFGIDTVEISGGTFTDGNNAVVQGIQKLDSIEQLRIINSTPTTIDDSLLQSAITKLIFADGYAGESVEVTNASTRTYAFQNDLGNATFTAKSGVTTLNLEFDRSTGTSNEYTVTANGHDLINIVTTSTSSFDFLLPLDGSSSDAIGSLQVEQGATVDISGTNAFTINRIAGDFANGETGVAVDATKLAGKLVLGASNGIDTIKTGEGGSVVTGGGSGDAITFGNGSDQALYFTDFGAAESGVVTGSGSAREIVGIDTITGFTVANGADKLAAFNFDNVFGGPTSETGASNTYTKLSVDQSTAVSNATSLTAAIDAAASAHTASGWTAFSYDGSTYALHERAANGNNGEGEIFGTGDSVVELVGVTVANLTQANFGFTEGQQYPGVNFNLLP